MNNTFLTLVLLLFLSVIQAQSSDSILFDFESGSLRGWELHGQEFLAMDGPLDQETAASWARGPVGFLGNYYLETGHNEGRHTSKDGGGTYLSPEFTITRDYLNFYLAGELHPQVRVFLEVEGEIVREAFGNNFYDLILRGWDVKALRGKKARLGLDDRSQYRSLIRLDHVFLSDEPPPHHSQWVKMEDRQRSSIVAPGSFVHIFDNNQMVDGDWVIDRANVLLGPDNQWHLFAVLMEASNVWQARKPGKIIHATSDELLSGWQYQGVVMEASEEYGEEFLIDAFVMVHDNIFYMYYVGAGQLWSGWYEGPEGNTNPWHLGASGDYGPNSMFLAVSDDGTHWVRTGTANPKQKGKIFTEKPFGLTPFVHHNGKEWVMYYASATNETVYSKHTIGYRTSKDLVTWSERRQALIDWSLDDNTEAADFGSHKPASPWPEHSFFTNPFVIKRGDSWHLWAGPIDNSNLSRYHCLRIYTSENPFSFKNHWHAKEVNKRVFVDGGGRPFQDAQGNWYIFHTNSMSGGVWVAPLFWNDNN